MNTRILEYNDIKDVALGNKIEQLVRADAYDPTISCSYEKYDMVPYTGFTILVRDVVAKKLATANKTLSDKYDLMLKIVYGYRSPEVQQAYYSKRFNELKISSPKLTMDQLKALTHSFVAVPDSAGHTLGAAIDLTLVDTRGAELDMGTKIADYSNPDLIKTFSKQCTQAQLQNRKKLLEAMLGAGFAPFFGEWWHFSYGDKEWAAYYNKSCTIYSPVSQKPTSKIYTIAGGNKTALLVADEWRGSAENQKAGESLMSFYKGAEQAGVFYKDINKLVMAGGEFCGNATAATASLLTTPSNEFFVSGYSGNVRSTIKSVNSNTTESVVQFDSLPNKVLRSRVDDFEVIVVAFDGITHILLESPLPEDYNLIAPQLISRLELNECDAVGVIWCENVSSTEIRIDPIVWVRNINTLFYETSCGSGSIAAAIAYNKTQIFQPSNEKISVIITQDYIQTKSVVRLDE